MMVDKDDYHPLIQRGGSPYCGYGSKFKTQGTTDCSQSLVSTAQFLGIHVTKYPCEQWLRKAEATPVS